MDLAILILRIIISILTAYNTLSTAGFSGKKATARIKDWVDKGIGKEFEIEPQKPDA